MVYPFFDNGGLLKNKKNKFYKLIRHNAEKITIIDYCLSPADLGAINKMQKTSYKFNQEWCDVYSPSSELNDL